MKQWYLLLSAMLLQPVTKVQAQTWEWATPAGSKYVDSRADLPVDLATDANGNSYLLSTCYAKEIYVGSASLPDGKGNESGGLTMLSSLNSKGAFRWAKVIGAANTIPKEVKVMKDRVYMLGIVGCSPGYKGYYDSDYTTPSDYYSGGSLACYDTSGHLQWVVRPDSVIGIEPNIYLPISFDVDESNNTYILLTMPAGSKIMGSSMSIPSTAPYKGYGFYVLKYNPSGSLLSVTMLKDFCYSKGKYTSSVSYYKMAYDAVNKRYYVGGLGLPDGSADTLYIKSAIMSNALFISGFAEDGSYLWHKTDNTTSSISSAYRFSGIRSDKSGNLIIGGSAIKGVVFNGYTFTNKVNPSVGSGLPFAMKLDNSGKMLWCNSGGVKSGGGVMLSFGFSIGERFVGVAGLGGLGAYFGESSDTFTINKAGDGQDGWFALLDKSTGKTVKMGAARGNGFYDALRAVSFSGDNFYIGGNFENTLMVIDSSSVTLGPSRSGTDVFVAKMSTGGLVSVKEVSSNASSLLKIYPNPAHEDVYVEGLAVGSIIRVYDMKGTQLLSVPVSAAQTLVSLRGVASGLYLLCMETKEGERYSARIQKE